MNLAGRSHISCRDSLSNLPAMPPDGHLKGHVGGAVVLGYVETALFEHRFWLQILGDHARFIRDALSPTESLEVEQAEAFVKRYDNLLQRAREPLTSSELIHLSQTADKYTSRLREFKLHLLRRHLTSDIRIQLPPTFINHMVNELEEYQRILCALVAGDIPPPAHPVHHHVVWLADAMGHSVILESMADPVERQIREKSHAFATQFEAFYLKAVEVAGYLRTHLAEFPALERLNQDVELEMKLFREFLHELEEMEIDASLLSSFGPLLPDHMAREECYYLLKLAETTAITPPACDPAKPRTSS
jgi:hypothetical protein